MDKIDFDDYTKQYNGILANQLQFFDSENYFAEYKVLKTKQLLTFSPKKILDFGCGIGRSTLFLQKYFDQSEIYGFDISEKSLEEARNNVPEARFMTLEESISQKYDLIFLAGVLHHIEPKLYESTFKTLTSMSNPGTQIVIFEHNPFNPVTRYLVKTCPFDRDATLLKAKNLKALFQQAGLKDIRCEYTLFFPAQLKRLRFLEKYLGAIPLGGQYVVSGSV